MFNFIQYQVDDVMTTETVTIKPGASLAEAQAIFDQHDFNGLPVVEEGDHLIGILTKLDLLKAFAFTDKSIVPPYTTIMGQEVKTVMTTQPVVADPEMPLTRVLKKMIETRHKSFPVVADGRLVGMVAREDVLKALARAAKGLQPKRLETDLGQGAK